MRIAYLSPLPPQRSGIADYSAELLPALAARCDLELLVAPGTRPDAAACGGLPVIEAGRLGERLAAGRYDAVLYQIGNDGRFHAGIYDLALRHPGVAVLHEVVLHHLVRHRTLGAGAPAAYVEALRYAYGRSGELAGRRALDSGVEVDPFAFPLFEELVDRSRAVLVHNAYCRERILRSRGAARIAVVPHHVSLAAPAGAALEAGAARAALGIAESDFVVASFGFVTPAKRVDVILEAFGRLRRSLPGARLALVGEVEPRYDAAALAGAREPGVSWIGRADLGVFLQWMAACDVAVNLRWPTGGETSGTLVRLLGMGKPVIASRAGAFAEIPAGCCALVDVGADEAEVLSALLRELAEQPALRREMGENARRLAAAWTIEASADGYARLLASCVEGRWQPRPAVPPLAPFPPEDIGTEILAHAAAAAADLGADESDTELLRAVAEPFVDLDLDEAWEPDLGRG
jgi:glycosyltransferase involved in cell wall biosynthesis